MTREQKLIQDHIYDLDAMADRYFVQANRLREDADRATAHAQEFVARASKLAALRDSLGAA